MKLVFIVSGEPLTITSHVSVVKNFLATDEIAGRDVIIWIIYIGIMIHRFRVEWSIGLDLYTTRCKGKAWLRQTDGTHGSEIRVLTEFHAYLQNLFICKTRTGRPLVFAIRFWNLRLLKIHWRCMAAKSGLIQVGVGCERAKPQR